MSMAPLILAIMVVAFAIAYSFVWFLCRAAAQADVDAQALLDARPSVSEEEDWALPKASETEAVPTPAGTLAS